MVGTPTIYKGDDATIYIGSGGAGSGGPDKLKHDALAISDFSLTLSKDTAEQELLGEKGSYWLAGSMSAEGSLTACKLHNTAIGKLVNLMIQGESMSVSGNCGPESLHFYLRSCQVTGFDFSIGTASDITEGSIDFTSLFPYAISVARDVTAYVYITDEPSLM
jgi:hypothetical protein